MMTLTTPVSDAAGADQAGWAQVYDFYLRAAISTPWGTVTTLRLTSFPGGLAFFAPTTAPEPVATRSSAQAYQFWPLVRGTAKSATSNTDDQFTISASNATGEWAAMLAAIEWRGTPVCVRKVPTTAAGALTASDCYVIFSGVIDSLAGLTLEQLQFNCSNGLGTFAEQLPVRTFHPSCNFRFADDMCGVLKWLPENYQTGTVGSGSTLSVVNSADFTSDTGTLGAGYGTDQVDALADANITSSTHETYYEAPQVKASASGAGGAWWMSQVSSQWGENIQGYWRPWQLGAASAILEPYITFDFGSAKALKLWQITGMPDNGREVLPRLIHIVSSPDLSAWTFETYFECPPLGGIPYDVLIPKASSHRYWRICLRSRYAVGFYQPVFDQVSAFADSRNWWRDGTITFGPATATVALRNVSRRISESYAGQVVLTRALPVAPAAGDTFTIARGCARNFNACCERGNDSRFGGFPDIGSELVANTSGKLQTATTPGGAGARYRDIP